MVFCVPPTCFWKLLKCKIIWKTAEIGANSGFSSRLLHWAQCTGKNECLRLRFTSFLLLDRIFEMENIALQPKIERILPLNFCSFRSFPSRNFSTNPSETLTKNIRRPGLLPGEFWIKNANSCNQLPFAAIFGHEKYSFLKQAYRTTTISSQHS